MIDHQELHEETMGRATLPLSMRETQVLEMASRGMTNSQMAADLCVSVHAVKFHLAAIYRKLGVANRTEAAVAYITSRSAGAGEPSAPTAG
jgi:DNA-binding NarL/FixJ family response regulator